MTFESPKLWKKGGRGNWDLSPTLEALRRFIVFSLEGNENVVLAFDAGGECLQDARSVRLINALSARGFGVCSETLL